MSQICRDKDCAENTRLTEREKEIAKTMLIVTSAKLVASELNISIHAVDYHCRNIRHKLNESKTFPAILKAMSQGLI